MIGNADKDLASICIEEFGLKRERKQCTATHPAPPCCYIRARGEKAGIFGICMCIWHPCPLKLCDGSGWYIEVSDR